MRRLCLGVLACAIVFVSPVPAVAQPVLPNVIGQDYGQAGQMLSRMGYIVRATYADVTSQAQHNRVLAQSPAGGRRVPPTQTIVLQVGRFTAVKVPSIVGRTVADAGVILPSAGLRARVAGQVSTTDARKHSLVASQSPAAGQMVPRGTVVDFSIYVSTNVLVPNVNGMSFDNARRTLEAVGLGVKGGCPARPGQTAIGTRVRGQWPDAGMSAPKGTLVGFAAIECTYR